MVPPSIKSCTVDLALELVPWPCPAVDQLGCLVFLCEACILLVIFSNRFYSINSSTLTLYAFFLSDFPVAFRLTSVHFFPSFLKIFVYLAMSGLDFDTQDLHGDM